MGGAHAPRVIWAVPVERGFLKNIILGPIIALSVMVGSTHCAWAQRANENALASAQDAFGTTVGNESIGLYTPRDVRGFDPVQAGNVRVEGLYFDRQQPSPQEIFISPLVSGSTMRVGISAQSYLFPAPTGIADVHLRIPGDKQVTSTVAGYGPYERYSIEVDSQIPLIADQLGLSLGGGYTRDDSNDVSSPNVYVGAAVARWRPTDNLEIIPFGGYKYTDGRRNRSAIFTAGPFLPPEIPRHELITQPWTINLETDTNYGVIANAALSDTWRLRAGLFRSLVVREKFFANLFQNTQQNGTTQYSVVAYPRQEYGSFSSEVRLSDTITSGDWRHTFTAALRGRIAQKVFGGSVSKSMGTVVLGELTEVPKPVFAFGPTSHDKVNQGTGGLAYNAIWAGVGELSVGLQKTFYHRTLNPPAGAQTATSDSPFLPNATLAIHVLDNLTAFGSYSRGLEENGEAPNAATNRGEALPVVFTSQIDAGLRYAVAPGVSAVVTAFEIKKPYLGLDNTNLFTTVGDVRHRGIEVSLAGKMAEGLNVAAGAVFLQARLSGLLVDQGKIGRIPIGRTPRFGRFDVEYGPASWKGLSADMQLEYRSKRVATADNLAFIQGRTIVSLGGRYRFKVGDAPASLRAQVRNITNTFRWDINLNQYAFVPEEMRRYSLTLAVDF